MAAAAAATKSSSQPNPVVTWIMSVDEAVSEFVFCCSLPKPIEALFSIPANWFGLGPILLVGPLWMAIVLESTAAQPTVPSNSLLYMGTTILTLVLLAIWFRYLFWDDTPSGKFFGDKPAYFVSPLLAIAFCSWWIQDPILLSQVMYTNMLWTSSLVVVLVGKRQSERFRPCAKSQFHYCINRKSFSNIPILLSKIAAKGSFPSGDAAGVAAFGVVLAIAGHVWLAVGLVLLACLGRLYFLAHHLVDTVAGCLVTSAVHELWVLLVGQEVLMTKLTWWQPLLLQVSFILFVTVVMKSSENRR